MKLIEGWENCWKWLSVNCMFVAGSIQGAWVYIPDDLRDSAPHYLVAWITIALLVLGIIGRITKRDSSQ